MSLREGAETVVKQCLNVSEGEKVVVVNDGNDQDLIDALLEVISEITDNYELLEYEEPENHGEEPPERIAEALRNADVFIAPTQKSISHTEARREANKAGARGVTMPSVTKELWRTSLTADYEEVKRITKKARALMEECDDITIETESGTDLTVRGFEDIMDDTGIVHNDGEFGNLPAGETSRGVVDADGTLVIDHDGNTRDGAAGAELEIRDGEVKSVRNPSEHMQEVLREVENSRNVAEFGFGTNPEATLVGNVLQDEKVLGTIHIALGDSVFYFPDDRPQCKSSKIHWDFVCENPTLYFGDEKVLDEGEPIFLD